MSDQTFLPSVSTLLSKDSVPVGVVTSVLEPKYHFERSLSVFILAYGIIILEFSYHCYRPDNFYGGVIFQKSNSI